jgi:hypothetical protein
MSKVKTFNRKEMEKMLLYPHRRGKKITIKQDAIFESIDTSDEKKFRPKKTFKIDFNWSDEDALDVRWFCFGNKGPRPRSESIYKDIPAPGAVREDYIVAEAESPKLNDPHGFYTNSSDSVYWADLNSELED